MSLIHWKKPGKSGAACGTSHWGTYYQADFYGTISRRAPDLVIVGDAPLKVNCIRCCHIHMKYMDAELSKL